MQGYGRDESAPTPGGVVRGHFGVFATYFVAVSCIFHGVFVAFWQTVSSEMAIRQQL